jgi:erythrin-vacuolar iron transport family protein
VFSRLSLITAAGKRRFDDLSEQEILALAISSEEEDGQIYVAYAERLRADYSATAAVFEGMAAEENEHRRRLIELYKHRFGDFIVQIRREHVAGYYTRRPVWLVASLDLDTIRKEAADMERQAHDFYVAAAGRATDADTRKLLGDLAAAEAGHQAKADRLETQHLGDGARETEDLAERRQFVLTWVQPGLAGLMDGSVSTLAPIFATAFATQNPWTTFLVGLSASVGAGISMGFTRPRVRRDDDARRPRPRAAVPDSKLPPCDGDRTRRGVHRAVGDRVDPEPLHGNPVRSRDLPGRPRRRTGARSGHPDRRGLARNSTPRLSIFLRRSSQR